MHLPDREFEGRLRAAWQADTSADPDRWDCENPSWGQCAVSALAIQDRFGGHLLRGMTAEGSHYWNLLPGGIEVDLTAEQFKDRPATLRSEPRARAYLLSSSGTRRRYRLLSSRLTGTLQSVA